MGRNIAGTIGRPHREDERLDVEQNSTQSKTKDLILEVEGFKATVEPLKGNVVLNNRMNSIGNIDNELGSDLCQGQTSFLHVFQHDNRDNDDYFHLTCHVDNALESKIEKGEFVELERLLPKKRFSNEDKRLEWVSKDGMTFLAPVNDKEQKITSVKKWDQAFKVYAAIYCGANPLRSKEVGQYIYVIHSAASTYQWVNVAFYDYTFRQMMSERPNRNWGKT